MGHIITSDGLKPDPSKIEAILNLQPPTDKAGIQQFLQVGMITYLGKFMPNLSEKNCTSARIARQKCEMELVGKTRKKLSINENHDHSSSCSAIL